MSDAASDAAPPTPPQAIAERFLRARSNAEALREYPGIVPADLSAAYAAQDHAIAHWVEPLAGWKVARIGETWRSKYGEERLVGPVFAPRVYRAEQGRPIECPVFAGGFAAIEAELVIIVGRTAPPDRLTWTIEDAREYVGSMHVGAEIASSPLAALNDLGPGAVVSDFGNNWGVIVGPKVERWQTLEAITAQVFIEEREVGCAQAHIRSGALAAFAFALGKCAQRGKPLHSGAVISTGAITGVHDIHVGEEGRIRFQGFSDLRCRATRALPRASGARHAD